MNRGTHIACLALLVFVLGSGGACSVGFGTRGDLTPEGCVETGVLTPVVAVGERTELGHPEVVVRAPALRLEVSRAAFRLVVPWLVDIEVSDLGPKTGFLK